MNKTTEEIDRHIKAALLVAEAVTSTIHATAQLAATEAKRPDVTGYVAEALAGDLKAGWFEKHEDVLTTDPAEFMSQLVGYLRGRAVIHAQLGGQVKEPKAH